MKLLIKAVLVIVLLIVVGAVVAVVYVDRVAKSAVESGATSALGVKTSLEGADVKILSSEFAMTGLNVANPEGFKTNHFMTLDDGGVSLTLASLMEDVIELPTLTLDGIDINLEKAAGKSNYNVILENMKKVEDGEKPADTGAKKQFIIRQIKITNVMVHADLIGAGQLSKVDVPIDEIILTDVGSDGSGLTLSDLSGVIMKTIFAAVISKGGALPGEIAAELQGGLAQLGDLSKFGVEIAGQALGDISGTAGALLEGAGGGVGEALEGTTGELEKAVDEGVGGLLKGAGGLLGGNKEEEEEEEDKPE